ncbi:MAG: M15 family metallopeptidase [Peptostreptococcaceae bacterium]
MSRLVRTRKRKIILKNKIKKSYKYLLAVMIAIFVLLKGTSSLEAKLIEEEPIVEEYVVNNVETSQHINYENVVLVNRENEVGKEYIPSDLVELEVKFLNNNTHNNLLKKEAATQLEKMFEDAKKEGINLLAVSGYRSYEYQKKLYENKVRKAGKKEADRYVAMPGTSEHQTGLAIDLLSTEYKKLNKGFENTNAYRWLCENIDEYGFIIRYQKGKESITGYEFEPWHFRYVGKDLAKELKERNITLEEYYGINGYELVSE